jgi:glutamate-5-semialdehyde dehydrogenase
MINLRELGKEVKLASRRLAGASTAEKNTALLQIADCLWEAREEIIAANREDVANGERAGLSSALLDRLMINEKRLAGIIQDLRGVVDLPDPVGEIFDQGVLDNGLKIRKQRVPLGVLAVVYEARPNVTVDVAGLALKSGNGAILRGGKEAICTNRAFVKAIQAGLAGSTLPAQCLAFIDDPDRGLVLELMKMYDLVDMLIPRGGASLHQFCRENSLVPVITGGIGICHLYVDQSADLAKSIEVVRNAKIQRPTVCNALDTVLVNRAVAGEFLPALVERLAQDGVTFRADADARAILAGAPANVVMAAGPEDFDQEWLSLVLGIRVLDTLDQAIDHIAIHSTHHSDGILTRNEDHSRRFMAEVDSAAVYVNASTRFTDGSQLGLGAEIAISTQRLHARGPMALRELTTYKWVVEGDYHVRP